MSTPTDPFVHLARSTRAFTEAFAAHVERVAAEKRAAAEKRTDRDRQRADAREKGTAVLAALFDQADREMAEALGLPVDQPDQPVNAQR